VARCPECNKFVRLDLMEEAEIASAEFDYQTKTLTLEVRLARVCAECCTEMEETILTIAKTCNFKIPDWVDDSSLGEVECQLSPAETTVGSGSRLKTLFGVEGEVFIEAAWREAGADQDIEWSETIEITLGDGSVATSDFDEI
jgi:hypothetical protein